MDRNKLKELIRKRAWVFLYTFIYAPWFVFLEKTVDQYYLIECPLDHIIPFCEYFIVPYYIWFAFMGAAFLWCFLKEENGVFYRFCAVMFGGMTIALIIYSVFPNGIQLRPVINADKNIFCFLTSMIYSVDTSTNVFPSLHVFTSAVIMLMAKKTELVKKHAFVYPIIVVLSLLIIVSTVFLKQHSVLDLIAGNLLAIALCNISEATEELSEREKEAYRRRTAPSGRVRMGH